MSPVSPTLRPTRSPTATGEAVVGLMRYTGTVDDTFLTELMATLRAHAGAVPLSLQDAMRFVKDVEQVFQEEQTLQEVQVEKAPRLNSLMLTRKHAS